MPVRHRKSSTAVQEVKNIVEKAETQVQKLLYSWHEIPAWQQDNSYILSGYVRQTESFKKCWDSLFYWHNETVNIYTHLIPSLGFFAGLYFCFNGYVEKYATTTIVDRIVISIFLLGACTALYLSSFFHCVKSHSENVMSVGNKLDYLGIIVLIIASMVSILYYSLMDSPRLRSFFWGLTCTLGAICSVFSMKDTFRSSEWRPYRASMFVLFGLSGALPVLSGFYLYGVDETFRKSQLSWVLAEGVLYCSGALLYAARVPERFNPGKYDIVGHSHQIFHVLVVIAAMCHGKALIGAYNYSHSITS